MSEQVFDIFLETTPVTQGSMKAYPIRRKNGSIGVSMVHQKADKLISYRKLIQTTLIEKYPFIEDAKSLGGYFAKGVPVKVVFYFYANKPKSNKLIMPAHHSMDIDKLARAVNDSLTGYVFYDDCQVTTMTVTKRWADSENPEGVRIIIQQDEN